MSLPCRCRVDIVIGCDIIADLLEFAFAHIGGGVGVLEALDETLDRLDVVGVGKERELVEVLASAVFGLRGCDEADKDGGSVGHDVFKKINIYKPRFWL